MPYNAQLVRNLMIASQYVHDHVMHFYHLHALDWVDVVSALSADPAATSQLAQSISTWPRSSPGYFADVQAKIKRFVEGGQLGIFANGYWGHPGYKLPPEANLMAVAHYLDALTWQRDIAMLHAIFGGKNPHPHFLVGGVPNPIDLNSDSAVNTKRLGQVQEIIQRAREFVDQVYVPDMLAIAGFYKDWAQWGEGVGNFLTYGEFPGRNGMTDLGGLMIPRGAILNRDLSQIHEVELHDAERDRGVRRALLLRLQLRQEVGTASVRWRDLAQLHRAETAFQAARRRAELFMGEVAALERPRDGGGAARARADALRHRQHPDERAGGQHAGEARCAGRRRCTPRLAVPPRVQSRRR